MIALFLRPRVSGFLIAALLIIVGAQPSWAQSKTLAQTLAKTPAQPLSASEKQAIEGIVKDYLLNNPKIIIEAIQNLRQREERDKANKATANLVKFRDDPSALSVNPRESTVHP